MPPEKSYDHFFLIKDGEVKVRGSGYLRADGTIRIKVGANAYPIVLRAACAAAGLNPQMVQKSEYPDHCLGRPGMNEGGIEIFTEEEYDARALPEPRRWPRAPFGSQSPVPARP